LASLNAWQQALGPLRGWYATALTRCVSQGRHHLLMGMGDGSMATLLANQARLLGGPSEATFTGLESHAIALKLARHTTHWYPEITLIEGDVIPPGPFDTVYGLHCLSQLPARALSTWLEQLSTTGQPTIHLIHLSPWVHYWPWRRHAPALRTFDPGLSRHHIQRLKAEGFEVRALYPLTVLSRTGDGR
jgi:hypothetical protein